MKNYWTYNILAVVFVGMIAGVMGMVWHFSEPEPVAAAPAAVNASPVKTPQATVPSVSSGDALLAAISKMKSNRDESLSFEPVSLDETSQLLSARDYCWTSEGQSDSLSPALSEIGSIDDPIVVVSGSGISAASDGSSSTLSSKMASGSTGTSASGSSTSSGSTEDSGSDTTTKNSCSSGVGGTSSSNQRPMVIWYFHLDRDSLQLLQTAIESGFLSHVSIYVSNRWTGTFLKKDDNIQKLQLAIQLCRENKIQTIFVRNLWPTYPVAGLDETILFDPDYYIQEILHLREEGQQWETDYVGLDIEPYDNGDLKSPVGKYLQWSSNYEPLSTERIKMSRVIATVIEKVGTVDFLYPAGSLRSNHFYNQISELGRIRIAESSYYDNLDFEKIKYPYEIFGVYVNTTQRNSQSYRQPFYTVTEVFEKSQRWSSKEGIFLYPKEDNVEDVAKALNEYSSKLHETGS